MQLSSLRLFIAAALLATVVRAHDTHAPTTEVNKSFLSQYEVVRAALAADDLAGAKKAAATLAGAPSQPAATVDAVKSLAQADSIKAARDAFKVVSKRAVHLAEDQAGYFHAHCPMVPNKEGDWVQTTKTINNPYFGKSMLTCRSIIVDGARCRSDLHIH
jgi:hypothetical protein